jgi:hypothetical protein
MRGDRALASLSRGVGSSSSACQSRPRSLRSFRRARDAGANHYHGDPGRSCTVVQQISVGLAAPLSFAAIHVRRSVAVAPGCGIARFG